MKVATTTAKRSGTQPPKHGQIKEVELQKAAHFDSTKSRTAKNMNQQIEQRTKLCKGEVESFEVVVLKFYFCNFTNLEV
jgi:hypothetical protein